MIVFIYTLQVCIFFRLSKFTITIDSLETCLPSPLYTLTLCLPCHRFYRFLRQHCTHWWHHLWHTAPDTSCTGYSLKQVQKKTYEFLSIQIYIVITVHRSYTKLICMVTYYQLIRLLPLSQLCMSSLFLPPQL